MSQSDVVFTSKRDVTTSPEHRNPDIRNQTLSAIRFDMPRMPPTTSSTTNEERDEAARSTREHTRERRNDRSELEMVW